MQIFGHVCFTDLFLKKQFQALFIEVIYFQGSNKLWNSVWVIFW